MTLTKVERMKQSKNIWPVYNEFNRNLNCSLFTSFDINFHFCQKKKKIHPLSGKEECENEAAPWDDVLTSSIGSSFSFGKELDSSPTRKGVGQHTMSNMEPGSTGMKVCCQEKG